MDLLTKHLHDVVCPTWNFANRCKTWDDHVWNATAGLAAESNEVLDVHKKMYFHAEKDRREEILEELGDVAYYYTKLIELHGFTLEEVLEFNKRKLFDRYDIKL
jgi:NTP pyrophosphatase (non-canonical NTP hydrolase)